MPNLAQPVGLYIGQVPPENPSSVTRWLSQSAEHLQPPMGWQHRQPIIGSSGKTVTATAQEFSPWYNDKLQRYEALLNIGSTQYFTYANSPLSDTWAAPVQVLGGGVGGESLNAQQCGVYVENGFIYASYLTTGTATSLAIAKAAMPSTVGGVPSFTKLGVSLNLGSVCDSPWLMKVNGIYMYFMQNQTSGGLGQYVSLLASSPDDLVNNPATRVTGTFSGNFNTPNGPRNQFAFGRAQCFYENGKWVLLAHSTSALTFGSQIYRWVCNDPGLYPVNWVRDSQQPLVRPITPYEIDQCADVRLFKGPNDRWFFFWTGLANNGFNPTNIICAPAIEPLMAFDGWTWGPCLMQSDPMNEVPTWPVDMMGNGLYALGQREDSWNDQTNNTSGIAQLPNASVGGRQIVRNGGKSGAAVLPIRITGTDTCNGGNPVVAASAVGTTVTLTFARPHGFGTGDKLLITGFTPAAYNVTAAAVLTVGTTTVAGDTLTYTAGSAPGANTVLGVVESGLMPGETRRYICKQAGQWMRG